MAELSLQMTDLNAPLDIQQLKTGFSGQIINCIESIHGLLSAAQIHTRLHTPRSLHLLQGMSEEKQQGILNSLLTWHTILSSPDLDYDNVNESALVDKALKHFNFRLKDQVWDTTAKQEVIEIYNAQGVQLYRSMNFFQTCGYSLLDLCVNEWFVLWERPRKVLESLNNTAGEILSGKIKSATFDVPPHIIRETYDDGTTQPFHPRSLMVTLKNISPTFNSHNEIVGFVCTSTCKVLSIGDDALKIGFI